MNDCPEPPCIFSAMFVFRALLIFFFKMKSNIKLNLANRIKNLGVTFKCTVYLQDLCLRFYLFLA